jgi:hypothetical protein
MEAEFNQKKLFSRFNELSFREERKVCPSQLGLGIDIECNEIERPLDVGEEGNLMDLIYSAKGKTSANGKRF